jgi:C1A family cysteine protease
MVTMISLILAAVPASAMKLDVLRQKIAESGAGWTAAETSLSHLSTEEFSQMLGFVPVSRDGTCQQLKMMAESHLIYELPAAFDWRNNNGNWVTPVKSQGTCGSCTAFATLAAFETIIMLDEGSPDPTRDLSEQFAVSCGPAGTRDGYAYGGCIGNYSDYIAAFLRDAGVPDEACFPYVAGQDTGTEPPCGNACVDTTTRVKKIVDWSYLAPQASLYLPQPGQLKAVLVNKPVPCGMYIYEDFKHYSGGIYEPVPGQDVIGGHLVCIIGYDDSQNCWIVKNSWGAGWGENGFFRIGYGETSGSSLTTFGLEALDLSYGDPVSTTTTTSILATTTTTSAPEDESPNVKPCAPYGWSYPIVPSSEQGTSDFNPASDVLYPAPRKTYVDFAVCNDSDVPLSRSFAVSLFIDGIEAYTAEISEDLQAKSYRAWIDEPYSFSEGEHTLLFSVDVLDEIAEADESDNIVEMTFSWSALWPGLYERMFGRDGDDTVQLLRRLRDEVLMAGGKGRACVRTLYRFSWEVAMLLLSDTELRLQTADVIKQLLPEAACLAEGETVLLSSSKLASCEVLLDRFASRGGPHVRALATGIKEKIREGALFSELGIQTE